MGRFVFFILLLSFPFSLHAQNAEETIAYMLYSIEDGTDLLKVVVPNEADKSNIPDNTKLKQTNRSPAAYKFSGEERGKTFKFSYSISKKDDCNYRSEHYAEIEGKMAEETAILANFSSEITVSEKILNNQKRLFLISDDECAFEISSKNGYLKEKNPEMYEKMAQKRCSKQLVVRSYNYNLERTKKALSYFRSSFCKGRGF